MTKPCPFCLVVKGEIPAAIVHRDAGFVAFLDHRPLFPGHVLVIPTEHIETLADLDDARVGPLFVLTKRIARAVEQGLSADGIFVANNNRVSQSVPHLHVHVIPRRKKDGLKGFFWPRYAYKSDDEIETVRAAIAAQLVTQS